MKISAALSMLALGFAQAKLQEAEHLEMSLQRALGQERDMHSCCEWVCPEPEPEPEPCVYRSKAMMMGGSYYSDDGSECDYRSKAMMMGGSRRLPGKGYPYPDPYPYPMPEPVPSECYWDCSGCGEYPMPPGPSYPTYPTHPHPGYMCFPTVSTNEDCECSCCGFLPPPPMPEPEPEPEPEPCVYRSKAMMMGGSYTDDGSECDYRSKAMMMGGSRRTKETPQQGERVLPHGPLITCECDCDPPAPPSPRSKAMMMGGSGKGMGGSGSGKGMMGGSGGGDKDSYYY